MKERAFPRKTVNIQADFIYNEIRYEGTITNFSKKGMYINTELHLPVKSNIVHTFFKPKLEIFLHVNGNILKVPVKVRRLIRTNGFYNGIGVDVYDPPQDYFELFDTL
jgi:hypothetical protein